MRLQTAKHHVVRVFQVALALVLIALVSFVSWNFAIQPKLRFDPLSKKGLLPNLSAVTEGLTFQHTEGGRIYYTLKARRHESFKDSPHAFVGVEVLVYGDDFEPDRRIQSDTCEYDPQSGDIEFKGNVITQLDEKTVGRTAALSYRNKSRMALTLTRIFVERPEEMTAAADRMDYAIDSGLLQLAGKVHATLANGAELDSDAAVFQRNENWSTVTGNVLLKTSTGWTRGDAGRAELEPDSSRPRTITITGNVRSESRSTKTSDVWELTGAERLELTMSQAGEVERAVAHGAARLEKRAYSEDKTQTLSGGELIAWVNPSGDVEKVEATQSARLESGDKNRMLQLTGEKIRIDPSGTIVTEGLSKMDSGDSTIVGRNFRIVQGEEIVTFDTVLPATVDTKRAGAPPRRMEAQKSTSARIDTKSNRLIFMEAIGSVSFKEEPDRRGSSDKATVSDGGDTIVLEGSAILIEPKTTIDARRIEIGQRGATLVATGAVKTVTQSDSGLVTVTANTARGQRGNGAPDRVFYSGNVRADAKSKSGPVWTTAQEAEGDSKEMTFSGNVVTVVQTADGLVQVRAPKGFGNADKMTYTGGARLWRDRDNLYIESERMEIWPKETERKFKATGNVHSTVQTAKGDSATLDYDDLLQTAVYSGNARLAQKDMTMVAAKVEAKVVDGKVSVATADGAVVITQGQRVGTGDRAVYNAKEDRATLTGNLARVVDPARGNSQGKQVVMELSSKNVTVTGTGEGASKGRVQTQINVK